MHKITWRAEVVLNISIKHSFPYLSRKNNKMSCLPLSLINLGIIEASLSHLDFMTCYISVL